MVRIVVMGVAGAGKSTVGRAVASRLGIPFLDADDFHSEADRALMAAGEPLDDRQRDVWIERVRDAMGRQEDVVVACSALRLAHRRRLQSVGAVQMFCLDVHAEELARRLAARSSHFFPATLLASQFAALEPQQPEEGIVVVDGNRPVAVVADDIVAAICDSTGSTADIDVDWAAVARSLVDDGWARLPGAISERTRARLASAAPMTWESEPEIGTVQQNAMSTGLYLDRAAKVVRELGSAICDALTDARPREIPAIPRFNEVRWSRSLPGLGNAITAHRDPPLCGGVIATVTLFGAAKFRVWSGGDVTEWDTGDGDLVLLQSNGWPTASSLCPMHEAGLPAHGERMILTYRHNKGGPGADYFSP